MASAARPVTVTAASDALLYTSVTPAIVAASTVVAVTAFTLSCSTEVVCTPWPRLPPAIEETIASLSVPSPPTRMSPAFRVVEAVELRESNVSLPPPSVLLSIPVVSGQGDSK